MKTYHYWFIAAAIFYIAENWWFGWNSKPSCTAERVCDYIVLILVWSGMYKLIVRDVTNEVLKKLKELAK